MVDPISDMIVRLKNAGSAGRSSVVLPASELKLAIAEKLRQVGYIKSVSQRGKKVKKSLEVELISAPNGETKIEDIQRVSKPSRRVYHNHREIRSVRQGHGLAIYSTPKGILTDKEARTAKVGGEILFKIW